MTRAEAEQMLADAILEIESELKLQPGMVDRVLFREIENPGDPLAKEMVKLICTRLDPEAAILLSAETESTRWC